MSLGCVSLKKSKIGFLNPKESENRFCVSLLNRLIQDLLDHGASKEPKNPLLGICLTGFMEVLERRKFLFNNMA